VYLATLFVVLEPYKYAGYPMLIKTVVMETQDDQLFSKDAPLLTAATELCYHTVNCSALNAEELRRERGIEVSFTGVCMCYYHIIIIIILFTPGSKDPEG